MAVSSWPGHGRVDFSWPGADERKILWPRKLLIGLITWWWRSPFFMLAPVSRTAWFPAFLGFSASLPLVRVLSHAAYGGDTDARLFCPSGMWLPSSPAIWPFRVITSGLYPVVRAVIILCRSIPLLSPSCSYCCPGSPAPWVLSGIVSASCFSSANSKITVPINMARYCVLTS